MPAVCAEGEGEREIMPEAMLGLPMDRRTVSSVRSILRKERVRISCFLGKGLVNEIIEFGRRTLRIFSLDWTLQKCTRGSLTNIFYTAGLVLRPHISF